MIIFLFVVWVGIAVEYRFSPRFDYLKEDSILMFFYSAKNNERKSIIFKL